MNSFENILRLETEYQDSIDSYKGKLKEIVEEGGRFLQQYEMVEGIGRYWSYDMNNKLIEENLVTSNQVESIFKELRRYSSNKNQIKSMLKDLGMSRRGSGRTTQYHLIKSPITDQYKYIFPMEDAPAIQGIGMVYAIVLKIFRSNLFINLDGISFEMPFPYSIRMSPIEEAFIYSLLVPYKEYKKCLEKFIEERKQEDRTSMNWELSGEWIQCISSTFKCDFQYTAPVIDKFYRFLYFEELEEIWKDLIERACHELEINNI